MVFTLIFKVKHFVVFCHCSLMAGLRNVILASPQEMYHCRILNRSSMFLIFIFKVKLSDFQFFFAMRPTQKGLKHHCQLEFTRKMDTILRDNFQGQTLELSLFRHCSITAGRRSTIFSTCFPINKNWKDVEQQSNCCHCLKF